MDAEGWGEAGDLRGLVHPEGDGAAYLEVVILAVIDEFHVGPPLAHGGTRAHGSVDDGQRCGDGPFRTPVVDLDGAGTDPDSPQRACGGEEESAQTRPSLLRRFSHLQNSSSSGRKLTAQSQASGRSFVVQVDAPAVGEARVAG